MEEHRAKHSVPMKCKERLLHKENKKMALYRKILSILVRPVIIYKKGGFVM